MKSRIENLKSDFRRLYNAEPQAIVRGPGRVDLLGIHTDYNDGFVLPIAVNVDVIACGRKTPGNIVKIYSSNMNASTEFEIDKIRVKINQSWPNYIGGVLNALAIRGINLCGMEIALEGNVPLGSGLSSSAAIEMASAMLFQALLGFEMSGKEMAILGQEAENVFVGVNTGIMDQFVSRLAVKNHALFLDCRTLEYEQLPFDCSDYKIVVCNTNKPRGLVDSEYDARRKQCEIAAAYFASKYENVKKLRDVTLEMLERHKNELDVVVRKRAEHVINENIRCLKSKDVLLKKDFEAFGLLMNQSHDSARDLYEVSCPELEAMVKVSRNAPGSLSGRLAGAGFGGCTVSLVESVKIEQFINYVEENYRKLSGVKADTYVCTAENGAEVIK